MKLYSGPLSMFTGKVRIALDEKQLPYELISVPFGARGYEPKHPEVLRINPKAQVPVLVDGDLALFDSTIILEYLEDRHPEPPLHPRDPAARARCRQLEAASDELFFPPVIELIMEVFYKPEATSRDAERVARAHVAIARHYEWIEARAGEGPFLCGAAFTVADIAWFMAITFATSLGAGIGDAQPRLRAWYERTMARPSVMREMQGLLAAQQRLRGG